VYALPFPYYSASMSPSQILLPIKSWSACCGAGGCRTEALYLKEKEYPYDSKKWFCKPKYRCKKVCGRMTRCADKECPRPGLIIRISNCILVASMEQQGTINSPREVPILVKIFAVEWPTIATKQNMTPQVSSPGGGAKNTPKTPLPKKIRK